jgi:hypothetical protein
MEITQVAPYLDPTTLVNLQAVELEVRQGFAGIIGSLQTIVFGDRGSEFPSYPPKGRGDEYIRDCAVSAYRYAIDGIRPTGRNDESFMDFSCFCAFARKAAECYGEGGVASTCEKVLAMAILRTRLDEATLGLPAMATEIESHGGPDFSLFEIAVLAQMNEKSVRNATQPTAPDRLKTIRVGARTRVTAADALDWLSRRRSFSGTTVKEMAP